MKLLAITDRRRTAGDPVTRAVPLIRRLGPRLIIQLREKDAPARDLFTWTRALLREAEGTGAQVMVNGRADVARCFAGAAGVHLPEGGLPIAAVRAMLGPGVPIGASVHDEAGARAAIAAGATLLAIAPVFSTPGKPRELGRAGLERVIAAAREVEDPGAELYALGGVAAHHLPELAALGLAGVAAIRGVWESDALAVAIERGLGA